MLSDRFYTGGKILFKEFKQCDKHLMGLKEIKKLAIIEGQLKGKNS